MDKVSAMYWDPTEKTSSENKEDEMGPDALSQEIRSLAYRINGSDKPSFSAVSSDLTRIIRLADSQSLARNVRTVLWERLLGLFSSETWDLSAGPEKDGLFDTNERGKGFKEGFVSFGAKPMVWTNAALIGGVLFHFSYSPKSIRSTSPVEGTPEYEKWTKGGGNPKLSGVVESGKLSGGYYNKLRDGCLDEQDFGTVTFMMDEYEQVADFEWDDPASVKASIQGVIDNILHHPPIDAYSKNKQRQQKLNPYSSIQKFKNFLVKSRRDTFYTDEVRLVAQAAGTVMHTVIEKLTGSGFNYDTGNAPFPLKTA